MANQTQILNVSDEMKFDDNVQTKNVKEQEENMYSSSSDTTEELCSSSTNGTCGDGYSADEKGPVKKEKLHRIDNLPKFCCSLIKPSNSSILKWMRRKLSPILCD